MLREVRSSSRPNPGQLLGKVENSLCRTRANSIVLGAQRFCHPQVDSPASLDSGMSPESQVDYSAFGGYRNGVGSVVRLQFRENAPNVTLYGFFRK